MRPSGAEAQTFEGFGACFNEMGYDALQSIAGAATQSARHPSGECFVGFDAIDSKMFSADDF